MKKISILVSAEKIETILSFSMIIYLILEVTRLLRWAFWIALLYTTEQQIFRLTESIVRYANTKQTCCALIVDFTKMFDKVWHSEFIYKMDLFGIGQATSSLIKNFIGYRIYTKWD